MNKFATAMNCIDGRTQIPVIEWMKEKYNVDYVDMITEPGVDGILAKGENKALIESIKRRVEISVSKHNSKVVAVAGHHDCAGNPVDEETHKKHILSAIEVVKSWGFDVEVVGLWVDNNFKVVRVG